MINKKALKITLITLGVTLVLVAIIVPTTLYFTEWKEKTPDEENGGENPDDKIDLSKQKIEYLAQVVHMNKITTAEATKIKTDIQAKVTSQMSALHLVADIDYRITNLEQIQANKDLNELLGVVRVESISTSEKATGDFGVTINVQENISTWAAEWDPEKVIVIEKEEADHLSEKAPESIKNMIDIRVQAFMSQGQINEKGTDYKIIGLELIKEGAKFTDYQNQVKVQGTSSHLTGTFIVPIVLEADSTYSWKTK